METQPRVMRLVGSFLTLGAVLLTLSAVALAYGAAATWMEGRRIEACLWAAGGAAFVLFGLLAMLEVRGRLQDTLGDRLRPLIKLGAIMLAITGPAWVAHTGVRFQQTGDLEAYGVAIGGLMGLLGVAAYWWLEQPRTASR